ncbi:hypothetical protein GCM10008090_11440 [Arenicella chitinivorans]|uniref:HEAT repeat domain-containing protein n=1 Tax=Arenicella chitinivorans TaxID=1329800 RepID=A0A918RN37_9GAMM|nr:HEAT repeat domain-containing protein [Arenicella chitinivorans]GHA03893.1 hypothetical protein GCM10008090_11440 [Arenicella chitinivorans]
MKFTPNKIAVSTLIAISLSSALAFAQSTLYEQGQRELDQKNYRAAESTFSKLVVDDPARQDAALYWLAYTQHKRRLDDAALATLEKLIDSLPESPWVDDALALQIEILDEQGETGELSSDEMKLYALNSLMSSGSNESLDTLKQVLNGQNSLQVKQRALFVLSQINSPEAFEIIVKVARDSTHTTLQEDAINVLGVAGSDAAVQQLHTLYNRSNDAKIKSKVLQSFMISGESDTLAQIARTESNKELKADAIHLLGVLSDTDTLTKLYGETSGVDVKKHILDALAIGQSSDALIAVANTDTDTELQIHAIERLGIVNGQTSIQALVKLYSDAEKDRIKETVIKALFIQQNAAAIVNIIEQETNSELKRDALKYLSLMDSEQSKTFFDRILKEAE